jgi:hypothetical protein
LSVSGHFGDRFRYGSGEKSHFSRPETESREFHLEHANIRRLDSCGAKGAHESITEDDMNRILELQLLQVDTAMQNETNQTNYSTCSHSACSTANGDGFEDL